MTENGVAEFEATTHKRFQAPASMPDAIDVTALGGGHRLLSDKKTDFTKALAERFLGLERMPGERTLRNRHVEYLMGTMGRSTFRPELVKLVSAVVKETGKEHRLNGQHTCWARVYMPDDYTGGQIGVMRYECETMHDARSLYASIDRGAPRTKGNVVHSYLAGTPEFGRFAENIVKLLSTGLAAYLWEDPNERGSHDGDDVAYLMQTEHLALCSTVGAFVTQPEHVLSTRHFLCRSPVSGAMFATFDKAVKASGEFWAGVRDGLGFTDADDPRLRLRNYLMTSSLSNAKGAVPGVKRVLAEDMYRSCLNCWNYWRKGEKLSVLRTLDKRPKAR